MNSRSFYGVYHGHDVKHLEALFAHLTASSSSAATTAKRRPLVFFAGDSSLDNKYWLPGTEPAVAEYASFLKPARSVPDCAHQLNTVFDSLHHGRGRKGSQEEQQEEEQDFCCINAAVEESTLGGRDKGKKLLPQDVFIRDHIGPDDVLVVSLGGNDIALKPSFGTIVNMGWLTGCASRKNIENNTAWGLGHFHKLMHDELSDYLKALCSKNTPRLIIPCMIYYPDEDKNSPSWANTILSAIGYNKDPRHVQAVINTTYKAATMNVKVPGTTVAPLAFSEAMDGKDAKDYVARVEPSAQGGAKMARLIAAKIFANLGGQGGHSRL